ncbi:MAG TPA: rhodanese-like domain-containing protein [Stellaceae bacterium]|nr:rhodanese-like domain-containing protein [Stellaceae bacterium]
MALALVRAATTFPDLAGGASVRHRSIAFILAGLVAGCSSQRNSAVDDASAVPNLAPADRPQYAHFLKEQQHRAFATGPQGRYGWSSGRDDQFAAILGAVYNCNKSGKALCAAYAVDDSVMLDAYSANASASLAAIGSLHDAASLGPSYANEAHDDGAAPQRTIHARNTSGSTPLSVPGAHTAVTRQVAGALAGANPPILLDVANSWGGHQTLPGAVWMRGAGDDAADKNAALDALFHALLASVAPDRNQALVIFCESSVCWQSYNAALRAAADGYVNVYWYRGGVAAWRAAGLPTVSSVLSAQLW